jgi:hypothetical protein
MPRLAETYDFVIVKDIDATHKFGNFCNRMHDRIINGEKIHDVYPAEIEHWLTDSGFTITRQALPKLWYPHFIVTGGQES